MPSFNEHMKRSTQRTGRPYVELNAWLDGDNVSAVNRVGRHLQTGKSYDYVLAK